MSSATQAMVWPSPRIASAKPGTFAAHPAEEIVSSQSSMATPASGAASRYGRPTVSAASIR